MLFASSGAFSMMDRYSSPCSLPAAIACVSWYIALDCSVADAPAMIKFWFISWAKRIISSLPVNASPAVNPSLPTVSITSRYAPRLACAEANIFCCRLSTLFWSSTMRDRRAVAPAIWSDVPIRLRTPDAAARVATTPLTLLNIPSSELLPACTEALKPFCAFLI